MNSKPVPDNPAPDPAFLPSAPTSEQLKETLRAVFDRQIPNYGDYNLVCGSNSFEVPGPAGRGWAPPRRRNFVIGYRWHPAEVIVAPFDEKSLTATGIPVAINMTNLAHVHRLPGLRSSPGGYEVAASTGKAFRFGVENTMPLAPPSGSPDERASRATPRIEQARDAADFHEFMADFVQRGLPA
ncbi:hypothetical protein ACFVWT_05220 [Arthrobacter sp. NPDC058288]|uniref:hypothetical protein n=1 Tax=Arthrobacter sp. NPDC058288 TaxID=3346424 RepID=UPI0036E98D6C